MKVLLINGSPHAKGSTYTALNEMEKIFAENGIETELVHVGNQDIRGCIACGSCKKTGKCAFDDLVNETAEKFKECDGLVVGASVVSARRGGLSATFDELNKYFTICGMPVASSQYWNSIHGNNADEALKDREGLQVMRTLAGNMSFLMKSIALGKKEYGLPEKEEKEWTNFIR